MLKAIKRALAGAHGEPRPGPGQERRRLELAALLREGRERAHQLSSLYAPVSTVKRAFSMPERIRLIEQLWRVTCADGQINLYEDHYVGKIAHLLYVPNTQSMLARNRARPAVPDGE